MWKSCCTTLYSSFTILSGVRLPAGLISIFLLHNLGRRFTVAGSHVAASVCLIICVAFAGGNIERYSVPTSINLSHMRYDEGDCRVTMVVRD